MVRPASSVAAAALAALCALVCMLPREAAALISVRLPTRNPERSFVVNATFISARCAAKYACGHAPQLSYDVTECSCDEHCWLHDTCCADAPQRTDWRLRRLDSSAYACLDAFAFTEKGLRYFQTTAGTYYGAYAVHRCADDFPTSLLHDLCLAALGTAPADAADAALVSPVTDPATGATYRNIFCAGCNRLLPTGVREWNPFRSCITLGPNVSHEMCPLAFAPPNNVSLHACYADLVANCTKGDDKNGEDICRDSPTSYVYDTFKQRVYRNWNCTICNELPPAATTQCASWPRAPLTIFPEADLNFPVDVIRNYHCPKTIGISMSEEEQAFWISLCPGVPRVNCEQSRATVAESTTP